MKRSRTRFAAAAVALLGATSACRQDMHDTPRYEPLEASAFFADGRSARPVGVGTIPRGGLREDEHYFTGKRGGQFVDTFPAAVDKRALERGRERYDIYCSPCHDRSGAGRGMVVRRGFRQPSSLHEPRLRESAPGYFFDVITNGFGVMPAYAAQIPVAYRWAIVAYVRALQLSQNVKVADLPPGDRTKLEGGG